MHKIGIVVSQVLAVFAVAAALGLVSNAVREDGLPLVMPFPPELKCPSNAGPELPIKTASALDAFGKPDTVFVDARSEEEFAKGHIDGSVNVPYLFVEPISREAIASLGRFRRVIVYCNTKEAEASRLMAGELSHAGVKGAFYLEGGFLQWVKAGGKYTGQRPQGYEDLK